MKIIYRASDDQEFDSEGECLAHERLLHKQHAVASILHRANEYIPTCPDCSTPSDVTVEDFYPIAGLILRHWVNLKCEIDGARKAYKEFEESKKESSK